MPNTTTAIKRAKALLGAAGGECSPCIDGPCVIQPCGYHCKYPYTDDSTMWAENCPACRERREAKGRLDAASPDTLRVLIVAAEALAWVEDDDRIGAPYGGAAKAAVLKALAKVEALFPEEGAEECPHCGHDPHPDRICMPRSQMTGKTDCVCGEGGD